MSGAAVDERQAPVEPEEGSGATKKQRTGGEAVAKAGKGAPKQEQVSRNKRNRVKGKEEGGGVANKQRSKCPHQRERIRCKECGGAGICHHQRERRRCKECQQEATPGIDALLSVMEGRS